ncbi:uncharacterized protein LOC129281628 [Lytechinus pictus]|uniref:uncharacterized protein LOC129281628 n=1 Tax=Lytechinus pictus TaxID=7653 RepID=UPI0030B9B465
MTESTSYHAVPVMPVVLIRMKRAILFGLGALFTAILATGLRGEWLFIFIQAKRLWQGDATWRAGVKDRTNMTDDGSVINDHFMKDIQYYLPLSFVGAFFIFYGVGGFLKWYYYIQRRERATDWKCQPDRFLQPADDKLEFWLGSFNMAIGAISSGILVTYIMNGGETKLYYNIGDYGWGYFLLSIPGFYVYNEASTYYTHRTMHHPVFYRRYHKLHHRFKAPTPWSAAAMHPYEFIIFQFLLEVPIFLVPLHAGVYLFWLVYGVYHGILSHSGIDLHSALPWQPSVMFHDDHHRYFHCNFGVNTMMFDRLHGTLRKYDRFYSETTFGGEGAPIQDSSTARLIDKNK